MVETPSDDQERIWRARPRRPDGMGGWWRSLIQGILPPLCLLCGAPGADGNDFCDACAQDLPRNTRACLTCAQPLPTNNTAVCGRCQTHPPAFDHAFVPFLYQPPLDFLVKGLKFGGRLSHAALLGTLFAAALAERSRPWPDGIIPVPLHPRRLSVRGFNQALELARASARQHRLALWPERLQRVRDTPPQSQLDARQRHRNPRGAFAAPAALAGLRVALFDDVVSTASTASECAQVLRAAGAASVELWAITRTSGD